jgi:hypothetical protein
MQRHQHERADEVTIGQGGPGNDSVSGLRGIWIHAHTELRAKE